ncbi:MAG: hypothetical protein U5O69_10830 [Candidatus Competibacteraceae bacterium]|nr:hypothetical protein [Candidatus Competibacteraceae bacterium]
MTPTKQLLESVGLHVRAFAEIEAFLDVYQPTRPGCLLLDIRIAGRAERSAQQDLREHGRGSCRSSIIAGYTAMLRP